MSVLALILVLGLVAVLAAARAEHALAAAFWGLTTLVFFVPAGALLALVVSDHDPGLTVLSLAVVASGIVDGLALAFLANRIRQRRPAPAAAIGRLTLAHHFAVFAVFGGALLVSSQDTSSGTSGLEALASMLGGLALPCAIGGFVGWRLLSAAPCAARARRIDA